FSAPAPALRPPRLRVSGPRSTCCSPTTGCSRSEPTDEAFRLRLGPRERQPAIGPHLAIGPRGRLLYALVQGSARGGDSVVVVDTVRRAIVSRIGLPRRTIFRVLAFAPQTQRVFAVGDRPAQGPQEPVVAAVD